MNRRRDSQEDEQKKRQPEGDEQNFAIGFTERLLASRWVIGGLSE
jgi:hypothetical protein